MKKLWSKNILIGLLFISNAAMAAYVWSNNSDLRNIRRKSKSQAQAVKTFKKDSPSSFDYDNEFQACYEELLKKSPETDEGVVHFHWTLTAEGQVDYLKLINSDFADSEFQECITQVVKNARLPVKEENLGMIVSHKFKFRRKTVGQLDFRSE